MKIGISKIDKRYPIKQAQIIGVKKSVAGTFFEIQSSKYFKPKHNKVPGTCIPIEELVTKDKNYLECEKDEIIVATCPICKNKFHLNYYNIKSFFTIIKNTITFKCNHRTTTDLYESKQYSFTIDVSITNKYNKKDVLMYIINNKGYYGLSKHKKTTK